MSEGSPTSLLHLSITRWIADNFYLCEGCTIPRWLLYEMYIENCSPGAKDQVNSATFGKLIRLVFPGLGTRRLGTRGSARYHYDGISIKKNSSFYTRYCFLLSEKKYLRHRSPGEMMAASAWQLSTPMGNGGDACSSADAAGYKSNGQKIGTDLHYFPLVTHLKTEEDRLEYVLPEFQTVYHWEQELVKKYPYEMVVLLAKEYNNYCQVLLQAVRMEELDKVEDCIVSFWKSLQPEKIAFMSLPDVCELFKYYDRQLFQEMENILLCDFLKEVSVQYLKSIRVFGKNVKLWLLNALEESPVLLQTTKCKEVTLFIKRLRRKTDLSNMAKTMRIVLNSNSKVTGLRSDLHAVINQGFVDMPGNLFKTKLRNPDELQNDTEIKCLNDLISLLAPSTDIRVLLNCMSSNLQAFVIEPSRNKEEFRKLAADFQLRWSFLLTAVSKAMTLNYSDSFGSWHLFNLLLLDYVAHIFQSYIEEEEAESFYVTEQNDPSVLLVYEPSYLWGSFAEEQPQANTPQPTLVTLMQSPSNVRLSDTYSEF
ncbi:DNA-binding protein RFX8 [Oxyura jamaicensis]|uniref:DNA-binding protein RFX8 n=1 Tax=Oxyura jamaicensis TaxID=8884 RepID=UPI0015A6513D|nr:DNA-binding protein RFX8 [Oxyura jamaicensis]